MQPTNRLLRIIPARAGFTASRRSAQRRSGDHPRSRGVYGTRIAVIPWFGGSSPLARGLHRVKADSVALRGIIPARAGFTPVPPSGLSQSRDHPRSRGVYKDQAGGRLINMGSSPLARGLLTATLQKGGSVRIIPARAGFTRRGAQHGDVDHGSSPLARGLPVPLGAVLAHDGIIPARAGFTRRARVRAWRDRDHPRSRGVYSPGELGAVTSDGSSPLARGLPPEGLEVHDTKRIIPARAGFTPMVAAVALANRDHPRSRGVYGSWTRIPRTLSGSSPLARGLLHPYEGDYDD